MTRYTMSFTSDQLEQIKSSLRDTKRYTEREIVKYRSSDFRQADQDWTDWNKDDMERVFNINDIMHLLMHTNPDPSE
jgi:hypothetical protein